jgi:cytochrome c biogenesis protein CcmG, thiol:disulfide interchange protein DsbE
VGRRLLLVAQGVAVGLVVLLFALLLWTLVDDESGALAAAVARGETPQAPDFTAERVDRDGELTLSSLRGKVVALNFWASWCIPCKDEAPFLERTWRTYRDDGLVVLGADWHDFSTDARRFMHRYGMTFPVVHDGSGSIGDRYGVKAVPETFLIDRQGRLVGAFIGAINTDEDRARLRAAVERAVAP